MSYHHASNGESQPPKTCDVRAAAKTIGCSTFSVRELIRRGELRAVRLGRLIRIPTSAIESFLEGGNNDS